MSSLRRCLSTGLAVCTLSLGCCPKWPAYHTRVLGERTNAAGVVFEQITWQSKATMMWYAVSPEGDYTESTPRWEKYFLERGSDRREMRFLRANYSRKDGYGGKKYWYCFYPVLNASSWVAFSDENFEQPARISYVSLMNTNEIVSKVRIDIIANEKEMPEMAPKPGSMCVANEDLADMHLYDGNTRLLYRTFVGGLKYHVYHILNNRTEDITEEQAAEFKKTAPGIHPVENLTWKLNQASLTGAVSRSASSR